MFRWGFIGTFRVDNGAPFGEPTRQSLSPLHLHLSAYGIRILHNPPRSPRKNAKVERNQGTTARWANVAQCADYIQLQHRLNQVVEDQRENYPSRVCQNRTRAQRYPHLFSNPKKFHVADFNLNRTYQLLAKGTWLRKVSSNGATDMFGHTYQIGHRHRGKNLTVTFDHINLQWIFRDDHANVIKVLDAPNLNEHNIRAFSFSQ